MPTSSIPPGHLPQMPIQIQLTDAQAQVARQVGASALDSVAQCILDYIDLHRSGAPASELERVRDAQLALVDSVAAKNYLASRHEAIDRCRLDRTGSTA